MTARPYYIITGAPSTGKTSILSELKKRGYTCHQEIAREIIKENMEAGIEIFPWNNMHEFSDLVLERMKSLVKTFDSSVIQFLDRSMVDLIGYMNFANEDVPAHYSTEALAVGYAKKVFFLPIWPEIYTQDDERKENLEEAKEIGISLEEAYSSLGFELVQVPHGTVEDRVSFILAECNAMQFVSN